MDRVDLTNEENMRSGEDRLALGSLNDKELHFAVEMAHLLRGFQKEGGDITINNYFVTADKLIIVMEQNTNPKTTEAL